MALYGNGDDDVWKCRKHPSKRRRIGICPLCLRDCLLALCPHCANAAPCNCSTSSSSSSSSDPIFRRSRSLAAIPFLRSRSSARASSFLSIFRSRSKKNGNDDGGRTEVEAADVDFRSRSVAVSDSGGRFVRSSVKARIWFFPSPIKAFRQSKGILVERSPLHRG